jgi:hypothetical protein
MKFGLSDVLVLCRTLFNVGTYLKTEVAVATMFGRGRVSAWVGKGNVHFIQTLVVTTGQKFALTAVGIK